MILHYSTKYMRHLSTVPSVSNFLNYSIYKIGKNIQKILQEKNVNVIILNVVNNNYK